jgi:hypothetical protein
MLSLARQTELTSSMPWSHFVTALGTVPVFSIRFTHKNTKHMDASFLQSHKTLNVHRFLHYFIKHDRGNLENGS